MNSASNVSSTLVAVADRASTGDAFAVTAISTPLINAVKNDLRSICISSSTSIAIRGLRGGRVHNIIAVPMFDIVSARRRSGNRTLVDAFILSRTRQYSLLDRSINREPYLQERQGASPALRSPAIFQKRQIRGTMKTATMKNQIRSGSPSFQ